MKLMLHKSMSTSHKKVKDIVIATQIPQNFFFNKASYHGNSISFKLFQAFIISTAHFLSKLIKAALKLRAHTVEWPRGSIP